MQRLTNTALFVTWASYRERATQHKRLRRSSIAHPWRPTWPTSTDCSATTLRQGERLGNERSLVRALARWRSTAHPASAGPSSRQNAAFLSTPQPLDIVFGMAPLAPERLVVVSGAGAALEAERDEEALHERQQHREGGRTKYGNAEGFHAGIRCRQGVSQ